MGEDFELVDADAHFICVRHRESNAEFGFLIAAQHVASGAVINPDTPAARGLRGEARRFAYIEAVRLGHVAENPEGARKNEGTQWEGLKGWR